MNSTAMRCLAVTLLAQPVLFLAGCSSSNGSSRTDKIASTTSYLESAARDVLGEDQTMIRLAEPGACPGHFDIRPSQAAELRRCRALVRFDFQKSLDTILDRQGTNQAFVVEVVIPGGLCQPESYLSACRQIADAFVTHGLLAHTNADARLQLVAARLDTLAQQAINRVTLAGLRGTPVIVSVHQKEFCEWLGLNVVATFRAADTSSVAEIDDAISAGKFAEVKLLIANQPEGRRTADALADRLHAQVAVFGNFPALEHGRVSFDDLLVGNVDALVTATRR
ncbi:MAG TPA: zinc ABC transporter substrate-binding protein [Verrucomicrobiae bacterium]|nr:zinc ABC transporter substrate-binding protein [Verrucomicrobiae bacterium]